MTPEDIKRLDELHAKMIAGEFYTAIYRAWPAIAAELERLREFEERMRSIAIDNAGTYPSIVCDALKDLDRKRGE